MNSYIDIYLKVGSSLPLDVLTYIDLKVVFDETGFWAGINAVLNWLISQIEAYIIENE